MQADINDKMRAILVDWLVEVHLKFKVNQPTCCDKSVLRCAQKFDVAELLDVHCCFHLLLTFQLLPAHGTQVVDCGNERRPKLVWI